ncbi:MULTISPECIES: energy-coupling factor transporter transmembrane component T family protein [Arcobacteraceae]|uniref:Cobalt transport protein n=3 Tax=Arcobacteraceae TaxID=2808963 RepID=A0ABX2YCB4_9BACT|nr:MULTISPECIES: energy-coupling factor transporter transmembrane component T [Arcobacteraceae]OCL83103.1 Cobalt transport protein [Arcobacter porcinus]OCL83405.1 Cobalt transport protein [Arcobacter porcinus]OCL92537.1 Cobalt transport protein [Arcobacter porcinus]OCL93760.1 Cobalt transport protein [Aliarcobacter thereius]OCL95168.1 Cobalt transport protein [Aliarcobacter thereius LMG 24486]
MRLNPAISLLSAVGFSLILSFSKFELFFILPIIFLIYLNYKNIINILKKLLFLNIFIVVLALFLYFESNINEALELFFKVNFILLFNLLLFYSSSGFDIVKAFMILRFPKKINSILYFTVKFIFDLNLELKSIKESLKARNFKARTDIFTYKTYGNIFGILFIKTIKNSESLKDTFKIRAFKDEIFLNYENSFKILDFILVVLLIIILLVKVVL